MMMPTSRPTTTEQLMSAQFSRPSSHRIRKIARQASENLIKEPYFPVIMSFILPKTEIITEFVRKINYFCKISNKT